MDPHIQLISESKEVEEDKNWLKILSIFFAHLVVATGMFYFWRGYLENLSGVNFVFFSILFVFFSVLGILDIFLIKGRLKIFLFTLFGILIPFGVVFFNEIQSLSPTLLRISILFFLFCFLIIFEGKRKGHLILNNSLNIKFFLIARNVLKKFVTGLLLFLMFLIYLLYFVWGEGDVNFGKKITEGIITQSKYFIGILVPGVSIDPESKMEEIIRAVVVSKLKDQGPFIEEKNGNKIYFSQLPQEMQESILQVSVAEVEKQIKNKFDFFNPQMTAGEFVFRVLKNYFAIFQEKWGVYFNIGLLFAIFLIFKGTVFLFYWLIELIAFLILKMLIIIGFAYESIEMRSRKFIIVG